MVYLIHFQTKFHHAQHYIGFVSSDLMQRIGQHSANRGARSLIAVNNNGITWQVGGVWPAGDREPQRELKTTKNQDAFVLYVQDKAQRFHYYSFTRKI
ncbi:MAG: hypothetical protein ACTHMD_04455 [Flavisolibacter sp.]